MVLWEKTEEKSCFLKKYSVFFWLTLPLSNTYLVNQQPMLLNSFYYDTDCFGKCKLLSYSAIFIYLGLGSLMAKTLHYFWVVFRKQETQMLYNSTVDMRFKLKSLSLSFGNSLARELVGTFHLRGKGYCWGYTAWMWMNRV